MFCLGFSVIQEYDFKFYIKFDTDTTTDVATFSIIRLQCHASPAKWVVQILHKLEMMHVRVGYLMSRLVHILNTCGQV